MRHSNRDLTEFLRARRASLRPTDVGLPETKRGGSLTQEQVAELIGVSRQWYIQFEAGDVPEPTLSLVRRTAAALRLGAEDIETLWRLASREALPSIARSFAATTLGEPKAPVALVGVMFEEERTYPDLELAATEAARAVAELTMR